MWCQVGVVCWFEVVLMVGMLSVALANCMGKKKKGKDVAGEEKKPGEAPKPPPAAAPAAPSAPAPTEVKTQDEDKTAMSSTEEAVEERTQESEPQVVATADELEQKTQKSALSKLKREPSQKEPTPSGTQSAKQDKVSVKKAPSSRSKKLGPPVVYGDIKLEPGVVKLRASGQIARHRVTNVAQYRMAAKLKCSDNNLFRLAPVYNVIEVGQTIDIDVQRLPGPKKLDVMVIEHLAIEAGDNNVAEAFRKPGAVPKKAQVALNIID